MAGSTHTFTLAPTGASLNRSDAGRHDGWYGAPCSGRGALHLALGVLVACEGLPARTGSAGVPDTLISGNLALPVTGEAVRRGDLLLTVATTGRVRSAAVVALKAETNGTVEAVRVRPGSRVARGEVLARLDPRPFELAVREAEAALAEAKIRLRANLAADSVLLTPGEDRERQQNALALSGVPAAEVRLERSRLDQERAVITAPVDGVVDRVDVAEGSRVVPGQDIATVVDVTHLRIEAQVLEHDLPFVRAGGEAIVTTPALDSPIRGRIEALLPLVDTATRAGRVVVSLVGGVGSAGGADRRLLQPGMYADLRLEASRLRGRTLVPARAVIERDGRPLVFVVKGGRAQWVYIVPGQSNGDETEVRPDSSSGRIPVAAGDTVLVEGHLTLTHDAPVQVTVPAPR
jgi:RND family efflux transporter MFP subunit